MQVYPIKPTLQAPGIKLLKLTCDKPRLKFAFKFGLRHYSPALHLLALTLRTALDHREGVDPAGDRAIALGAATRLGARLKGEEAAEEALERAAGGALARIAAAAEVGRYRLTLSNRN